VTAEFAVALPAVVLVLVLGVSALSAAGRQVRLQDAAADAARLVGRGEDPARAGSAVAAAPYRRRNWAAADAAQSIWAASCRPRMRASDKPWLFSSARRRIGP
jgi:Flp pilus assembly protein TadG